MARLPEPGQVAIVLGRGHSPTTIETDDPDLDVRFAEHLFRDSFEREQPSSACNAELDSGYFGNAERMRFAGRLIEGVRVLGPVEHVPLEAFLESPTATHQARAVR